MAGRTRITIRDVAAEAGVSITTVSRALNGHADVGAATRERVAAVAERLGYRPAAAARTLPTGGSALVAAVVSPCSGDADLHQPFVRAVLAGVGVAVADRGRQMLVLESAGERGFAARCRDHQVAGAVLLGFADGDAEVAALVASGLPAVGLDLDLGAPRTSWVGGDHRGGAAAAIDHLVALGHERIALLPGVAASLPARERTRGWRDALAAHGLRPADVAPGDFTAASGRELAATLLADADAPTAIVTASDEIATGVLRAAAEAGRAVPGDLSVVGFDDLPLARWATPPLTTVRQDPLAVGAAAAALLERCIAGDTPAPAVVPVDLAVRGSTGVRRSAR